MTSLLERSLGILEILAEDADGASVRAIARKLDIPPSAAHRLLNELARYGYVRQDKEQGDYTLTLKLAAMGLSFLGQVGVTDLAQPILDRLATTSGELIRLSVIDGDDLVWVAVAQGATSGLRYDPGQEQGVVVHLASTAGGLALLSSMTDEEAVAKVMSQGFTPRNQAPGPMAPKSIADLLALVHQARERGYSIASDSYILGMAAMAIPVRFGRENRVIGVLSIAGPATRMTPERMAELAPVLEASVAELSLASRGSKFFAGSRSQAERKAG